MDYIQEIDSSHTLLVKELHEYDLNCLRIELIQAGPAGTPREVEISGHTMNNMTPIDVTPDSKAFCVTFDSYVSYNVLNESHSSSAESHEVFSGKLFRVYTKSNYLDYVRSHTSASDVFPGPLAHYCIVCSDHIIDIVSAHSPEVEAIDA